MKRQIKLIVLLAVFILPIAKPVIAESEGEIAKTYSISGHVVDKYTGEDLLGATIYIEEINAGTVTNDYGFYSISLEPGNYTIRYSFIGYENEVKEINLKNDIVLDVELRSAEHQLDEVVITGEALNNNVTKAEMSVTKMDVKTIKQIPALMGEVDVIKAIQLLPGVQTAAEGSSGFSVRGGSIDQNLILLDEAVVYNPSHLMGFFSVFNNDAIKDVKLYKGDIPAAHGGRLSSLLDVRMKDGNLKHFIGTGGIGTISSRFTFEGPLEKDKASFIISGRRTYADIFLAFSNDENLRDNKIYFYDLNAKVNYKIDDNNRIFASLYYGKDVFKNDDFGMGWGNQTETIRWNHLFGKKLFSNFTLIRSVFDYYLGVPEGEASSFRWDAVMRDYSLKADFSYFPDSKNKIKFGLVSTFHNFQPGSAVGLGGASFFNQYTVPKNYAIESGIYLSNEQSIDEKWTLKYGLRFSLFNNIGRGVIYNYDREYVKIDSTVYPSGEIFNTYSGLEPRLGVTYLLNERSSIKASYSRNFQYIHLATNSTAGTPLDVWFPSSPNVKPQIGDQFALGYFRNFRGNTIETSMEAYYKFNQHAIDFKDHAELLLNKEFEGELRFGEAWSYGMEFLVKMQLKKLNGWISYTLSKSERRIPEINNGKAYRSPYDRPHDISVVLNYQINERWLIGANWVYMTGQPVTFPTGRFEYGNVIAPVYSSRNEYRLPDYHRLDLSVSLKGKQKPGRKWQGEWNFSLYNAYGRKNPWVINFEQEPGNPDQTYAESTYLFGIVPSITYNFHF
ncbi:MAG: TonB-dependent receptor [Bacteroidota bacterium]|nr:TonB-dependent receptor [Bacteroidota bacterium]